METEAAKEITLLIKESSRRVSEGAELSEKVGESLALIVTAVESTAAGIANMAGDRVNGFQAAGIFNLAGGSTSLQVAGIKPSAGAPLCISTLDAKDPYMTGAPGRAS